MMIEKDVMNQSSFPLNYFKQFSKAIKAYESVDESDYQHWKVIYTIFQSTGESVETQDTNGP